MRFARWIGAIIVLTGTLMITWIFVSDARNVRSQDDPDGSQPQAPENSSTSEAETLTVDAAGEQREPSTVTAAGIVEISGLVRSREGEPIARAEVELVWATSEDAEWECAWHADDWGGVDRVRLATESGPDGKFAFPLQPPELARGAVLSAAQPGFEAGVLLLTGEPSSWAQPVEIVLEPAASMTVLVLDAQGKGVAGALVEQFGATPPGVDRPAEGLNLERSRRLLRRAHTTSADGSVTVAPFSGPQVLVARRGKEASVPWRGTPQERVTLRLLPTFEIGGRVSMPTWEHLSYVGERRITIAVQSRNLWRPLHTIRSVESGAWGPVTLPRLDADRYRVRLEGSPIVPVEWFFDPPAPGTRLEHDLVTEIGANLWFRVADEEDRVIPTAMVDVQWQDPENPEHWNFVQRAKNESGQINVWSVPRGGSIKYSAFAPGYVPYFSSPVPTSFYEKQYAPIVLKKAARLHGVCRHRGEPVEDFEVVVWQSAQQGSTSTTAFVDRADGTFELDTVPAGTFWVTASSALTPACEPIAVSCEPGETAEVTLELLDGLPGRGRVLEHGTGLALTNASIQLFVKGDVAPSARWGLPLPVRADGSFEFPGFLPGTNYIRAIAPGYSSQVVVRESSQAVVDFGDVHLTRAQDLRITLEPRERAEGAVIVSKGAALLPGKAFTDGEVVYRGISAGNYGLTIVEADDSETFVDLELAPGEDWALRARIGGPNRLSVRVVSEEGDAMSEIGWIEAAYQSSQGFRTVRTKFPRGREVVEFEGIDAPSVTVQAFDLAHQPTTGSGTFEDGRLELELWRSDERFQLTVVDAEGEPISDVRVIVKDPAMPGFSVFGGTDGRGACELRGVPAREVLVSLQHGSHGSHFGIPIDASSGSAEIVLDARARLELEFRDEETPLAGVTWSILDATGASFLDGPVSDESGRATLGALGADRYRLRATRPDCWSIDFQAEARTEGGVTPVQLRRLGELEIEVVTGTGLPVSGLEVELTSVEFGEDVATWITKERVRSAGLTTDLQGRIRVERLPRGPYSWRIARGDAEPVEGLHRVELQAAAPLRIVLP